MCYKKCKLYGYKYFGLQYGKECFCGNTFGKYGKKHAIYCMKDCPGYKRKICGGKHANSVYQIINSSAPENTSFSYKGCYKDTSKRDLY